MKEILLVSGIPLKDYSSFFCQLNILKRGFLSRGYNTTLISPISEINRVYEFGKRYGVVYIDYKSEDIESLFSNPEISAIIMLGYLDQFDFLRNTVDDSLSRKKKNYKMFLWAQFSRVPDISNLPEGLIFVPLTETTERFCRMAGVKNMEDPIPHAVDTDIFYPIRNKNIRHKIKSKLGLDENFVIGTVGKNSLRKRFDDIVLSFRKFLNKAGNPANVRLLIKTDRTDSIAGFNIIDLLKRNGIDKYAVILTGDMEPQGVAELYNIMDLYLHLAEWEGFGIPVIEAMACGTPVVTHQVQGPGEIVDGGGIVCRSVMPEDDTGANIRRADLEDVSETLYKLYRLYNQKGEDGLKGFYERALRIINKNYSMEVVVGRWLRLIES